MELSTGQTRMHIPFLTNNQPFDAKFGEYLQKNGMVQIWADRFYPIPQRTVGRISFFKLLKIVVGGLPSFRYLPGRYLGHRGRYGPWHECSKET